MKLAVEQSHNPLVGLVRADLEGRFNEADILKRQWDRIQAASQGIIVPPFEVLIHPSSACNLLCVWCIGDHIPLHADGKTLEASKQSVERLPDTLRDPGNMRRLIDGIIQYKESILLDGDDYQFRIENVQFSGLIGEPLASRSAILAVVPILAAANIRTGLFTNGILLNDECFTVFQELNYINVSVDAGRSETYDLLKSRRKGADTLSLVLRNIEALTSRRSTATTLEVNASFVLFPENHHEVYLAASLLKERGVRVLKIKQDISGKRLLSTDQRKATAELLDRIERDLVDSTFRLYRIHDIDDYAAGRREFANCRVTNLMASVGSDGNLYPCNYHPRPHGIAYGSAVERPFKEIWEGTQRAIMRKSLPHVCPDVCDPFKNRSNRLLEAVDDFAARVDNDTLRSSVQEAIAVAKL